MALWGLAEADGACAFLLLLGCALFGAWGRSGVALLCYHAFEFLVAVVGWCLFEEVDDFVVVEVFGFEHKHLGFRTLDLNLRISSAF